MDFQFLSGDPAFFLLLTLLGFAVLIIGRQIFWIFIASLGLVLGLQLSSAYYHAQFEWQVLLMGVLIAALGALLAFTLQRLAAGIAGFLIGWYLTNLMMGDLHLAFDQIEVLLPYLVAIISGLLVMIYFEWGVIVASSLAGAAMIVNGMQLAHTIERVFLLLLALLGIAIQAIWFMQEH